MFLNVTKRRNPQLIKTGVTFHQSGDIPPNTYIIDVDMLKENTRKLTDIAMESNMRLYYMTKQLGRIPQLARIMEESGIEKAVAVDFNEGKVLADNGMKIGHAGHLVQPGKYQWEEVLKWRPEVVTVFSIARAGQVSKAALKQGIQQSVLLKVVDENNMIHPGQEGGFMLDNLPDVLSQLKTLKGIKIVGVVSFPMLQLAADHKKMEPTPNMETLLKAKVILESAGIEVLQVNGAGATSCVTIPDLAKQGITHGEPGHAMTGTTPLHAYYALPEKPAIIYVTELSHSFRDTYYAIGGGSYARSNVEGALVGHAEESILEQRVEAKTFPSGNIDYYLPLKRPHKFSIETGDSVIYAFRTQIFETRANIALVSGIQEQNPKIMYFKRRW